MPKVLLITAGIAFVILLAVTIWMLAVNWNEKLFSSILSIAALGVAATFVTVFAGMKEVNVERTFLIEWPYDRAQRSLPMVIPASARTFELTLSRASMRASVAVNSVDNKPAKRKRPAGVDDVFRFFGELIQAEILNRVRDFEGTQKIVSSDTPTAFVPVRIPHNYKYSGVVLTPLLKQNSFLNDSDVFVWNHVGIQLPKGTEISLITVPSPPTTGPERHIVQLSKANYFDINFQV